MARYIDAGGGLLVPDTYAPRDQGSSPADVTAAAVSAGGWNPFGQGGRQGIRKAAEKPLIAMGLMNPDTKALRMGRIGGASAGLGSVLALIAAANELNDPNESAGRNVAQAGGMATGTIGGGALGALAGSFLGPVGTFVGGALGGALGGEAGKGLASFAADLVEGSPTDQALRDAQKQARVAMGLEAERMKTLLPVQDMAAKVALQNEVARAKALTALQNDAQLRQNMAQAFLMQQHAGAQQQLATTQAVLGGMG
jgi:hypothetical protein